LKWNFIYFDGKEAILKKSDLNEFFI